MIGDCSKLAHAQTLIYSLSKLGAELQAVVQDLVRGHPPKRMWWFTRILEYLRGELSGSNGEHVGPMTEAIGEQQDVRIASWCDREEGKVVNTDGETWTFRWRH